MQEWLVRKTLYRRVVYRYLVGKRRANNVFLCLQCGLFVKFNPRNFSIGVSLCKHQRDKSCSCSYVENVLSAFGPCSKQHAIGAHLHCAAVLVYRKLLELEEVGHGLHVVVLKGCSKNSPQRFNCCSLYCSSLSFCFYLAFFAFSVQ